MQRPSKYCINNTGEGKRNQGAPEHIPYIGKKIGLRQFADQKCAGGNR